MTPLCFASLHLHQVGGGTFTLPDKARARHARTGSEFFRWMEDNFVVTAGGAVRRQADERRDVISMKRFLRELCHHPHLASRDHYVGLLAKNLKYPLDFAHKQYDRLVGRGRDRLDGDTLKREIQELTKRTDLIKKLVGNRFAHTADERRKNPLPKFEDLEKCIDFFEDFVKRYVLLLRGDSVANLLPTFQYDWKEIFRFAWIEDIQDPSR